MLVVEDTAVVAVEIVRLVESFGLEVVGPIGHLDQALMFASELDQPGRPHLDLALLDVNLSGREVFPLAQVLVERGVPIVFLTGYTREAIPEEFRHFACLEKPFAEHELEWTIKEAAGQGTMR